MRRELLPLVVCFWCAFAIGVGVTAASHPKPSSFGAALATVAALIVAVAVTQEYLKS